MFEMARVCARRPCDFFVEVNGTAGTLRFDYPSLNELWYGDTHDDTGLYGLRRLDVHGLLRLHINGLRLGLHRRRVVAERDIDLRGRDRGEARRRSEHQCGQHWTRQCAPSRRRRPAAPPPLRTG